MQMKDYNSLLGTIPININSTWHFKIISYLSERIKCEHVVDIDYTMYILRIQDKV